jgi:hypothetical protein
MNSNAIDVVADHLALAGMKSRTDFDAQWFDELGVNVATSGPRALPLSQSSRRYR